MYPQIDGEQAKLELDFSASLASSATYMHGVDDVIGLHDVDEDDDDDDEEDDDCGPLTATTTSRSSMTSGGSNSSSSSSSGSNDSSEADVVDDYEGLDEVDGQLQISKATLDDDDLLKKPIHAIDIIVKSEQQQRHLSLNGSCLTTATAKSALLIQDIIYATATTNPKEINYSNNQIKSEQYNNHNEASTELEQSQLEFGEVFQSNETDEQKPVGSDIEVKVNIFEEDLDEDENENETDEDEDEEDEDGEAQIEDEENEDVDDEEDEDEDDNDDEEEEDDDDDETDEDDEDSNDSQSGQENLYIIDEHHHYPLHHFNHNPHHQLHHNDHTASLFQNSTQNHLSHHNHQHHHHLHLGQSFDQSRFDSDSHHFFSKQQQQEQCQNGLTNHLQNNINHSNHQNANSLHNLHLQHHPQYHLGNQHHLSNHQQQTIDETSGQQYYMTNGQQHHEFQQQQQQTTLHQIHPIHHQQNNNNNDITNAILIDLIPQNDDCSDLRSSETEICSNDISTTTTTTTTTTTSMNLDSTTTTSTTASETQLITSNPNIPIESNNTTKSAISDEDIVDGERMLEVTRKLVRSTERDPDRDLRKQVLLKTAIKKLPHFMEYNSYNETLDQTFHTNHNMSQQHACYEQHDSQPKFYHSVQPNAIQMSTTSLRMLDLNDDDQDKESQLVSATTTTTTLTTTTTTTTTPTAAPQQPASTPTIAANTTPTDYMNGTSTIDTSLESNEDSSFYHNTSHDSGVFSPRSNKRNSSWIGSDDEMEIDNLTELSTRSQNIESDNLQHIKKLRKKEILDWSINTSP